MECKENLYTPRCRVLLAFRLCCVGAITSLTVKALLWWGGVLLIVFTVLGAIQAIAGVLEIIPASPTSVSNCIPFGNNTFFGFTGFIYRDVPAFTLQSGLKFAFDLGSPNNVDVRRNIYFAVANKNPQPGSCGVNVRPTQGIRALGWTKVVSDSQIPLNPRGNSVSGDYELIFTAEAPFSFPGGGLIVGFGGSPPGAYADADCNQVLVHTDCSDASGHFYARFFFEADQTMLGLDGADANGISLGGIVIQMAEANQLTALSPAKLWVGLKNSDDIGTALDLMVELHYKDGRAIASGLTRCVRRLVRNANNAQEVSVAFEPFDPVALDLAEALTLKVLTRIGTNADDTRCTGPGATHTNAQGLRLYYDSSARSSGFEISITPNPNKDLFLHSDGSACPSGGGQSAGVMTRSLNEFEPFAIDAKCQDSGGVNFAVGNPFKEIGTWEFTVLNRPGFLGGFIP